ncbi:hypothetical protein APA_2369 [Pseudanabaena sp. lw0831]|nr:hypothetical protein APA_2369 [Pseudanabaena sp. lw0831]
MDNAHFTNCYEFGQIQPQEVNGGAKRRHSLLGVTSSAAIIWEY